MFYLYTSAPKHRLSIQNSLNTIKSVGILVEDVIYTLQQLFNNLAFTIYLLAVCNKQ